MAARRSWVRLVAVVFLLAGTVVIGTPRGAAAAVDCGGGETILGTILADVIVPPGQSCFIGGAVVRGGVTTGAGAYLYLYAGAVVRGSVSAPAAAAVFAFDAEVRGSMTVTGTTDALTINGSEVRGNLTLAGDGAEGAGAIYLVATTVRGSVSVRDISAELLVVGGNAIGGALDCADNVPDPVLGGFPVNSVGVAKRGECAGL